MAASSASKSRSPGWVCIMARAVTRSSSSPSRSHRTTSARSKFCSAASSRARATTLSTVLEILGLHELLRRQRPHLQLGAAELQALDPVTEQGEHEHQPAEGDQDAGPGPVRGQEHGGHAGAKGARAEHTQQQGARG
jgi:hypothetical protein